MRRLTYLAGSLHLTQLDVHLQESTGIVCSQKKGLMTTIHATLAAVPLPLRGVAALPASSSALRSLAGMGGTQFKAWSFSGLTELGADAVLLPFLFLLAGI